MKKTTKAIRLAAALCAAGFLSAQAWAAGSDWSQPVTAALPGIVKNSSLSRVKASAIARPAAPSIYDQLQSDFQEAQAPTEEDIQGQHPGRCYDPAAPNVPYARVLLGGYTASGDNGPLFGETTTPKFFFQAWMNDAGSLAGDTPADRYDQPSQADASAASSQIQKLENYYSSHVPGASTVHGSMVSRLDPQTFTARKFVQYGNPDQGGMHETQYIIVKISGQSGTPADELICYFF